MARQQQDFVFLLAIDETRASVFQIAFLQLRVEVVSISANTLGKQTELNKSLFAAARVAAAAWSLAHAYEAGQAGCAQMPGITLGGISAEVAEDWL